jgi:hypothetical protein
MRFPKHSRYESLLLLLVVLLVTLLLIIFFPTLKNLWSESLVTNEPNVPNSRYLETQEVVFVPVEVIADPFATTTDTEMLRIQSVVFEYIEVTDGCGPHFAGECLNARSGPGTDFSVQRQLRNGIVLKVGGSVERDGERWYKIAFDEFIRYPERMEGDSYVHSDYVTVLYDKGDKTTWKDGAATSTDKRIVVNRSQQLLSAYEGEELYMELDISTGLELTPTPRGTFTIFKKTPSRYMQGPLPNLSDRQVYDLPGVPWNLYFTQGGAVIHGAYWHDSFGSAYSHGCVNLPVAAARTLYTWADLGTKVIVED